MNLFFGGTILEVPLVVGGPILIIVFFYLGKKGRPENYIAHLIRFYLDPGFFSAGEDSKNTYKMRRRIYE